MVAYTIVGSARVKHYHLFPVPPQRSPSSTFPSRREMIYSVPSVSTLPRRADTPCPMHGRNILSEYTVEYGVIVRDCETW